MRRRILVVEDDQTLRQALTFNLVREGYEVLTASDGEAALETARGRRLDLVLLDVMLPGMSGIEVLRVLRREGITTPILILSAKVDEIDRVVGLKVGADDYITKPFSRPELLARVEAVLRRTRGTSDDVEPRDQQITSGRIVIDRLRREVVAGDVPIHLTTKEFDLLSFLASHPGRIYTRDQILAHVWGYDFAGDTRTVDVHVSWLRTKLRDDDRHDYFRTARGVGYAFNPKSEL